MVPLRVVRLGPLDACHESVRSLHLDNLSSRSAKADQTLAAAKGMCIGLIRASMSQSCNSCCSGSTNTSSALQLMLQAHTAPFAVLVQDGCLM